MKEMLTKKRIHSLYTFFKYLQLMAPTITPGQFPICATQNFVELAVDDIQIFVITSLS